MRQTEEQQVARRQVVGTTVTQGCHPTQIRVCAMDKLARVTAGGNLNNFDLRMKQQDTQQFSSCIP
jgi:hypothetical protein